VNDPSRFDVPGADVAWCPGCGNFSILQAVKQALGELGVGRDRLVMVSGIGQAAKAPHYLACNLFDGLHGRALPPATAIKAVDPSLTVVVESGDGDMYGEGGNHFIHAIRRNPDLTVLVHDNMVYGLTKGQASPTSRRGFTTPVQVGGVRLEPFNPLSVAIALDASFVARGFVGDVPGTAELIRRAVAHRGFALVDLLQPCVTFNKLNTWKWFREHTYRLEEGHDPRDRKAAFARAIEEDPLPLGIFYLNPDKPVFEDQLAAYADDPTPVPTRSLDRREALSRLIHDFRA
jgi:2-oxoglutarate ferredoxin oxidoreductase subunit beta